MRENSREPGSGRLEATEPQSAPEQADAGNKQDQSNNIEVKGPLCPLPVQLRSPSGSNLIHVLLGEDDSDDPSDGSAAEQGGDAQPESPFGVVSHHLGRETRWRIVDGGGRDLTVSGWLRRKRSSAASAEW